MKKQTVIQILRGASVSLLLVIFGACASTRNTVPEQTHLYGHAPSTTFPRSGQPDDKYAYAHGLWDSGEYEEAAMWFERAADVRTVTGEWEFENLLNATVAWLEAGNPDAARASLKRGLAVRVQAPPSEKARYLQALLLNGDPNSLQPELRATLPRH